MKLASLVAISMPRRVEARSTDRLQHLLIRSSLFNLLLVACIGVLLRSFPFLSSFPLEYKNILHGHSHFAFGGWVMPALLGLIMKNFPEIEQRIAYKHWRNISWLLLISAYGMLFSFPLQGYKAVSISFSTLSIVAGFYFAVVVWRVLPPLQHSAALQFLKAGLFYLVLSSLGPFATGPLIAMGKTGSPLYFDVIYFYLHFQYNGWFLFAILALFYQFLQKQQEWNNGFKVFALLNAACLPSYFLSILWHQPSLVFNLIGGVAAAIQCVALFFLLKDVRQIKIKEKLVKSMFGLSIGALVAKMLLQLIGAWPSLALMAYHQRNFVIAYLHLVLLGVISLFLLGWIIQSFSFAVTKTLNYSIGLFIAAFLVTELLIIAWPLGFMLPYGFPQYALLLLLFSILLPIGIGLFIGSLSGKRQVETAFVLS